MSRRTESARPSVSGGIAPDCADVFAACSARRGGLPGRVTQMLHKLPISPHIRHELARVVLWSPGSSQIAIDDALLGGQNGLSAAEYAAATGDLFWPSRRVVDGPHADLLRRCPQRR